MTDLSRISNMARTLSLEASVPTASVEGLLDRLPHFFSNVKTFLGDLMDFSKEESLGHTAGFLDDRKLPNQLAHNEYTALSPIGVFVPPGLKVTYLTYFEALEHAQNVADTLVSETLAPFNTWIAIQITNPEKLANFHSASSIANFKLHDIERPRKELSNCFDANAVHSQVPFEKAFRRTTEYRTVAEKANALNERLNSVSKKEIMRLVSEISQNLDKLLEMIKNDPDTYRANANTVRIIATICEAMARECEFFSVYYYQMLSALNALKDSEAKLKEIVG